MVPLPVNRSASSGTLHQTDRRATRGLRQSQNGLYYDLESGVPMRAMMFLLTLSLSLHLVALPSSAASESSGTGKAGSNQGLTLDDVGRGLKSAAKNIEEEIPKIGPAIGKTFKQVTGSNKGTDNSPKPSGSQNTTKSKR